MNAVPQTREMGGDKMSMKEMLRDLGLCILSALPVFLYAAFFALI